MTTERVLITHPDVDDEPVSVTRRAFEKGWSKNGWQLVGDDTESPEVADTPPPDDHDDITLDHQEP